MQYNMIANVSKYMIVLQVAITIRMHYVAAKINAYRN